MTSSHRTRPLARRSLFSAGVVARLAIALGLSAVLWATVLWATA